MENEDHSIIKGKALERHLYRINSLLEFSKLFTYNMGDDRAIVIIGAAFIDTILEYILIEFFPEGEKEVENLLKYDKPLGTYGNKIKMLYCLGLIEKMVMDDLKLIGKIRNSFAHNLTISFEDDDIKTWCIKLNWHRDAYMSDPPQEATPRDYYQVGVNTIIGYLTGVVGISRNEKRKVLNNF